MLSEKLDWMDQALNLLKKISEFPKEAKLIMMLRHSEREPISSLKKNRDLQLTENGRIAARTFGKNLPLNRYVRLFYSNTDRCRHTALEILNEFQLNSGEGVDGGILEPLYALRVIKDNFFKYELRKFSLLEIMNRWITEQYDYNDIESIKSYSKRAASIIWSKLDQDLPVGGIDIHISHEILLMALRSGWFDLSPNDKWTEFLGGYVFTFTKTHILLLDFDNFMKISYPNWWTKKSYQKTE
jgi:broad specificity phosphatase PhoE